MASRTRDAATEGVKPPLLGQSECWECLKNSLQAGCEMDAEECGSVLCEPFLSVCLSVLN